MKYISDLRGTKQKAFNIEPVASVGPPTSGTHRVGDLAIDSSGQLYNCITAGTPGSWVKYLKETDWDDIKRYGFLSPQETTISFNDTNYTFTLSPISSTWSYWRDGVKYTITGAKTVTLAGSPPTAGLYFVKLDSTTGTLSYDTNGYDLTSTALPVATILWNNSLTPKYYISDERHTCLIDRRVHYHQHLTRGAQFVSGGALSGFTIDTDTNAAHTFGVSACRIIDEDIIHDNSALADPDGSTLAYTIFYRTAASSWAWKRSDQPFSYTGAGYVEYDNAGTLTAGTGGAGANTRWINYYLIQTNLDGNAEIILVPGQNIFTSLAAAQAENPLGFTWTGLPIQEFVIMYQLTWALRGGSSKGKCELDVNPKAILVTSVSTSSVVSGEVQHNSLAGLQGGIAGEYYHLTSAQSSALHDAVTVLDTSTVDLVLSGQQLSANVLSSGIKLDDLGTPDDTTDLNASSTRHGLLPKLSNDSTQYLTGQGTWSNIIAGAGKVVLDADGINILVSGTYRVNSSVAFYNESTDALVAKIDSKTSAGTDYLRLSNTDATAPTAFTYDTTIKSTDLSNITLTAYTTASGYRAATLQIKSDESALKSTIDASATEVTITTTAGFSVSGGGATSSDGQLSLDTGTAELSAASLALKGDTISLQSPQIIADPYTVVTLRGILEQMAFSGLPSTPSDENVRIHNKFGVPYFRRPSGVGFPMTDPYRPLLNMPFISMYNTFSYNTAGAFVVPDLPNGDKALTGTNVGGETTGTRYSVGGFPIPTFGFNGSSAFLSRTNAQYQIASTGLFAFGAWIYPQAVNRINPIFYVGVTTPTCSLIMLANNTVEWRVWNTAQQIVVNPATTLAINTWHFVTGYWAWFSSSNYNVALQINGIWTTYSGTAPATTARTASGDFRIGRDGGTNYFQGLMHIPHSYYQSNTGQTAADEHFALMRGLMRSS